MKNDPIGSVCIHVLYDCKEFLSSSSAINAAVRLNSLPTKQFALAKNVEQKSYSVECYGILFVLANGSVS